ncbi:hypothetical protein [Parapedobacter soli]|uniref:hypothetical protein n=1 Tax=Parapedobacter soli TaxID=416955 RepID=UPI0021C911E3|nr:hypothetical protein [Parapedobacter soli]
MNKATHKIPFVIQVVGYVAFIFSFPQEVVRRPYITYIYESDCNCPPHGEATRLAARAQKPGCSGGGTQPLEDIFRYPLGMVRDEREITGGYYYG